jgi:hypothetical protein
MRRAMYAGKETTLAEHVSEAGRWLLRLLISNRPTSRLRVGAESGHSVIRAAEDFEGAGGYTLKGRGQPGVTGRIAR